MDIKKDEAGLITNAKHWDIRAVSDQYGLQQTLNFNGSTLPPEFTPVLYDLQTGTHQDVRTNPNFTYASPQTQDPYSFMLLIGDNTKPTVIVEQPNGGEVLTVGTQYTIQWNSSDGTGVLRNDVYYSSTGTDPYTLIGSTAGNVHSFDWIPPSGSTSSGRIKVVAQDSVLNEQEDVSDGTFVVNQTITYSAGAGWNLVSPPLQQIDMSPASVFGDNYLSTRYYVFGYTPSAGYTVPPELQLGQGYWLGSTVAKMVDVTGISATSQSNTLVAGYNIIGDPFITDEPQANLRFTYNSQTLGWGDAVSAGWLSNALWGYDGTNYVSGGTSLAVWKGYWIPMIFGGVAIQYTPQSGGAIPKQAVAAEEPMSRTNWHVNLGASLVTKDGEKYSDAIAQFGVQQDVKPGFDSRYDVPRPPKSPADGFVEISFPVSGELYPAVLGESYARMYTGSTEKPEWSFVVKTSGGGKVTLNWNKDAISALSNDIMVFMYDGTTHTMIDMKKVGTYTYDQKGTTRKFTINNADHAIPSSFQLAQNYPNPFNPTTVIQYQMPNAVQVQLEIYNILGEKVVTLVNGQQDAGYYTVAWNGRN